MGQVAAGMEAGDLADGLGQGIGQAPGRVGGSDPVAARPVADPPQRPGQLDAAAELQGRAGRYLVGGGALLTRELIHPLVADHLEPVCGIKQQRGVGEGKIVGPVIERSEQDHGGGRGAGMGQVAARVEAGDLADGLGQGIGQATERVAGQGEQSGAELADVPGRAVAATSARGR